MEPEGNRPWTSTLSVKEWASVSELGIKPLGQVMGSCFYHLGQSFYQNYYNESVRLSSIERAFYECRELAVTRLRDEAAAMGADAVVGVSIKKKVTNYFSHEHEFIAMGTAVKWKGLSPAAQPYLCTVSGQDLLKLLAAGSLPVGIVIGISIYYLCSLDEPNYFFDFTNREMKFYTRSVYDARHHAIEQMKQQCSALKADGVLSSEILFSAHPVEIDAQNQKRTDRIIEFAAYGTALREIGSSHAGIDGAISMIAVLGK